MKPAGLIFALDLGTACGYAIGMPGKLYQSGTVHLKRPPEHRSIAFSNLIAFLAEHFADCKPTLVVKEAMLPLQAFKNLGNAANTVVVTAGLHAITEAMCVRFGIRCEDIADSTVRKHFVGHGRMGSRAEVKAATVKRCHVLGYMPKECTDHNRADAIATWALAAATYGRSAPGALHLYGESAA